MLGFSNIIYLSYSEYNYKTIVHCNELIISIYEKNETVTKNLKFLNNNFNLFKFKKLTFTPICFKKDELKKILQPYPNIKFYTIT